MFQHIKIIHNTYARRNKKERHISEKKIRLFLNMFYAGKVKGSSFSITRLSQHTVKMIPICLMIFIASTP